MSPLLQDSHQTDEKAEWELIQFSNVTDLNSASSLKCILGVMVILSSYTSIYQSSSSHFKSPHHDEELCDLLVCSISEQLITCYWRYKEAALMTSMSTELTTVWFSAVGLHFMSVSADNLLVAEHSLQHSCDGETWRQSGGKVFQWMDNQINPEGHRETVMYTWSM